MQDQGSIRLSIVRIPKCYSEHKPSKRKIAEKRASLEKDAKSLFITVNQRNFLVDGYATYLAAVELGFEYVRYVEDPTAYTPNYNTPPKRTYIYGVHHQEIGSKEYVWVVRSHEEKLFRDVKPGDKLLVCTKCGTNPMFVTRIERLRKPPITGKIRCVAGKARY